MQKVELAPYIFFSGNCAEAFEFYKKVFGGEINLMKVGDVPAGLPGMEDIDKNYIMNASLSGGDVTLRGADSKKASPTTKKVELCLTGSDEPKLRATFEALSEDGQVKMPLTKMFWGDLFGQMTDKFGVEWMINIGS